MTTIIGPGVNGELKETGVWWYTHTVTRKDTTYSNGSLNPAKSQSCTESSPRSSRQPSPLVGSSPTSSSTSGDTAAAKPAALRPASEVANQVVLARTDEEANVIRQRDREVVRAFAEWYNAMPGAQIGEWTVDIFIRTHLGGEQ